MRNLNKYEASSKSTSFIFLALLGCGVFLLSACNRDGLKKIDAQTYIYSITAKTAKDGNRIPHKIEFVLPSGIVDSMKVSEEVLAKIAQTTILGVRKAVSDPSFLGFRDAEDLEFANKDDLIYYDDGRDTVTGAQVNPACLVALLHCDSSQVYATGTEFDYTASFDMKGTEINHTSGPPVK